MVLSFLPQSAVRHAHARTWRNGGLLTAENVSGIGYQIVAIRCASCDKITVTAALTEATEVREQGSLQTKFSDDWKTHRLLPLSTAKPQPEYIPKPLRDDYDEACAIRDLSPKASATLVRRCLQGMIRNFCGISKPRLVDEIRELRQQVEAGLAPTGVTIESVEAIDQVRSVGNIGAHMESDINLIIEVDPGEAQLMIGLIEMLFEDWYVSRHQRQIRLAGIKSMATAKEQAKKGDAPAAADPAVISE